MKYTHSYSSPLGEILMAADDTGLTGLWFSGQKHFARGLCREHEERLLPIFRETENWLDIYFSGKKPEFVPQLHLVGTEFQTRVWELLLKIPYGQTVSYGELAQMRGLERMSARTVGTAVGKNKISLIVPCHRVIGADGSLTGYAGGIERKAALLELEAAGK